VQWYVNVPAVLKVVVLLAPGGISPVSHAALSLVDVWTWASSFLQVTVAVLWTVILAGVKELAPNTTVFGGTLTGAG
jgi:hypothetical protein